MRHVSHNTYLAVVRYLIKTDVRMCNFFSSSTHAIGWISGTISSIGCSQID